MIRKHIYTGALLVLLALQLIDTATASRSLLSGNRSCACPYSYMPVCGSDGRQYANRCMAECLEVTVTKENAFDAKICRNIAIDSIGPQHPQQQPQKPGSDRQTLPVVLPPRPLNMSTNSAALGNPPCRCPKIYLPVCGSDGKLYNSKCLAECQQGVKVTDAQPDANRNCRGTNGRRLQSSSAVNQPGHVCPCPRIYRPVCGSNGKQYDNECIARCEGVSIAGPASGSGCAPGSTGSSATGTSTTGPTTSGPTATGPTAAGPTVFGPTAAGPAARPAVSQPGPSSQPIVSGPVTTGSGPASGPAPTGSGAVATGSDQPLPRPSNPRQDVGQFGFSCGCQVTYEPVCGKDAKWYPNLCSLNCAGVGLSAVRPDKYGNCLVG